MVRVRPRKLQPPILRPIRLLRKSSNHKCMCHPSHHLNPPQPTRNWCRYHPQRFQRIHAWPR